MGNFWLALRTKSRHESIVESILRYKHVITYLPKTRTIRVWRGHRKLIEKPMFPGYLFVRPKIEQFAMMRYIRGSCGFVRTGNEPSRMLEKDIDFVRALADSGKTLTIDPGLVLGRKVRITEGPLMGIEGELIDMNNYQVLVLNVALLNSNVRVRVSREIIELI